MLKLLFWSMVEETIKSKVEGKIESILNDDDLISELNDKLGGGLISKERNVEIDVEIREKLVQNVTDVIMSGIGVEETEEENNVLSGYWLPNNLPKE
jgi:hypothetical protein